MKAHAELNYFGDDAGPRRSFRELRRSTGLNWYQIAVVTVATFAVAMDLMFPPLRTAGEPGVQDFLGHVFMPLPALQDAQVDFVWLAAELAAIVIAAVAGWWISTPLHERRQAPRAVR